MNIYKSEFEGYETYTDTELAKAVKTMAKRANTRLRAIEKAGFQEGSSAYKKIERFAFDELEFMDKTAKGEFKFKTATSTFLRTREELLKEMEELNRFLYKAKSSTILGIKENYSHLYEYAKEHGYKGDFEDFMQKKRLDNWGRISELYGSDVANDIVNKYDEEAINEVFNKYNPHYDFPLGDFYAYLDEEQALIDANMEYYDGGLEGEFDA